MQADRFPLLASMVIQGVVALTFALAFLGLWRGFRRQSALLLAVAFFMWAVGLWFTAAGLQAGLADGWPAAVRGLVGLPLLLGALLFRPAADAMAGKDAATQSRRYGLAVVVVFVLLGPARGVIVALAPDVSAMLYPYLLPRLVLGSLFLWASLPLVTRRREVARPAARLAGATLAVVALRMYGSVAYELWTRAPGAPQQPENALLSMVQIVLLIFLGVAATLLLTEEEGRRTADAARTIRLTGDALQASEARFRFIAEHSFDLQVLVGDDRRVRYISGSCRRLLGFDPVELTGRDAVELIHVDDRPAVAAAMAAIPANASGARPPASLRLRHRSGELRQFEARGQRLASGMSGEAGEVTLISMHDVTDQRRLEATLLRAQKMDSLGRMAGGIAHDFRNTLTALGGGIELLKDSLPPGSPLLPQVLEIEQAAASGNALTRQLLAFASQQPIEPQRFDVGERLRGLQGMLVRAVGKSIDVQLNVSAGPLPVRTDPGQFDQVLLNLALNAKDAMPNGGRLEINATLDIHGVRVEVADTGGGIPPEIIDRIFEPFFTTKEAGGGTGLGLAAAYGFARQSGGSLSASSSVGVGSRFVLELPLDA